MSEEKGRKILLICMVVVFISIFIDYLLLPKLSSLTEVSPFLKRFRAEPNAVL